MADSRYTDDGKVRMSDGSETATAASNLPDIDEKSVRAYRLERVKAQLVRHDLAGIVLFDPINVRYATGSRNMQVWAMHNAMRYAFIAPDGPVILFDYPGSSHLSDHLETVDEQRPAIGWDFLAKGTRNEEHAERWAAEIADLVIQHGGGTSALLSIARTCSPCGRSCPAVWTSSTARG
jgi:Xaa-Pro dipeptidase